MAIRAVVAGVTASLLVAAAPAEAAKPCTFRGARTIVQNAKVRVYKQLSKDHALMKYYGCVKRSNKTFKLDAIDAEEGRAFDFHLSGFVVGYAMHYSDATGDSSQGYVAAYNVKRRALLRKADATTDTRTNYSVNKLLMTPGGVLVWTGGYDDSKGDLVFEVHIYDDSNQMVDGGSDIDATSLTVSGKTVAWRRAGLTKTATIGA